MASISKYDSGIVVRWDKDDWLKGLVPVYGGNADELMTSGMIDNTAINPYRNVGFLSPGYGRGDGTGGNAIDAYLKNGDSGYIYGANRAFVIEAGENIHQLNADSIPTLEWTGTISGTSVVGEDIIFYKLDGELYVFYSYNTSTKGDIGLLEVGSTNVLDDDYVSAEADNGATLNKDMPHPMIVGDDDILYIGDGNNLASLQGFETSDGIFNPSALDLPDGFVIRSFAQSPYYLVVIASRFPSSEIRGEARAFFWDMVSPSFDYSVKLPGNYADAGFTMNGKPYCFVQGQNYGDKNKDSHIVALSELDTQIITTFDKDIPSHGGVDVFANMVVWNSKGNIMSYGAPYKGMDNALNHLNEATGTANGMLKSFYDNIIVYSTLAGVLQYIKKTSYDIEASAKTGLVQLPQGLGKDVYVVDFVRVGYKDAITTDALSFALRLITDSSPNDTIENDRGLGTILYDSGSVESAYIDSIVKIYSQPSGVDDGKTMPTVRSSVGVYFEWGNGDAVTSAPCIEYVEVYLTRKALSETNP